MLAWNENCLSHERPAQCGTEVGHAQTLLSLAAVVLKLESAPGFTGASIPLGQEKRVKSFLVMIVKSAGAFLLVRRRRSSISWAMRKRQVNLKERKCA